MILSLNGLRNVWGNNPPSADPSWSFIRHKGSSEFSCKARILVVMGVHVFGFHGFWKGVLNWPACSPGLSLENTNSSAGGNLYQGRVRVRLMLLWPVQHQINQSIKKSSFLMFYSELILFKWWVYKYKIYIFYKDVWTCRGDNSGTSCSLSPTMMMMVTLQSGSGPNAETVSAPQSDQTTGATPLRCQKYPTFHRGFGLKRLG